MLPNYYKIFGLTKSATKEEIKKQYRRLAKEFHPDINKNSNATAKMQEILEAYYILNDEEVRFRYDRQYEKIYESKEWTDIESKNKKKNRHQDGSKSQSYNDPILEKWIITAKKQAIEFIKNTYKDSKGISKNGCKYFFKALGINILIFIIILLIIIIYKNFNK